MDDILTRALTVVGFGCILLALWLVLLERNAPRHRRHLVAGLLLSTGLGLLAAFFD